MPKPAPVAAVTGASGYLGSRICATLEARGWQVVKLIRSPSASRQPGCTYELAMPVSTQVREVLRSADVLVHAAYDLSLTSPVDIWRVNVEGTRRLLEVAAEARMRRILVLSSMSAFEGTTQFYGRAKLDIEAMTEGLGGCAVRPGLVVGERPGGMAAALQKLTRLPIVPLTAGAGRLYTVREDDLMEAIAALAAVDVLTPGTVCVAHPIPVLLEDLLIALAALKGQSCRFVSVPWQPVYWLLRTAEALRLRLPFRADSLLGLVHTASGMSGGEQLTKLGVSLHAFAHAPADRG